MVDKGIIRRFEEREGIKGIILCDSNCLPIESNVDIEITEDISEHITSLIRNGKQIVNALKEGGLKFIRLETSKDEIMIALEEQFILIILKGDKPMRDRGDRGYDNNDDDDRFPYPYIFTPPKPPDDFEIGPQVQVLKPLKEKESEEKIPCQYCGRELTKEEQFTHSCKKKPKNR